MIASYYTNLHQGLGILIFGGAVPVIIFLSLWLDHRRSSQ